LRKVFQILFENVISNRNTFKSILCITELWCMSGVLRHNTSSHDTSASSTVASHQHLTLDQRAASIALQALQCLCHVFSWVPLPTAASQTPAPLLTKLFHFAMLGCQRAVGDRGSLAETALCCINELIAKNQVPSAACEQFVLALFVHAFSLVKTVTRGNADTNDQSAMIGRFDQLSHRLSTAICVDLYVNIVTLYSF